MFYGDIIISSETQAAILSNMVLLHQAVCNLHAKSNFKLCNVLHDMYNKEVFHYVMQFMWQTKFTPYLLLVSLT